MTSLGGLTALDLFCGAGGLSEGFRRAGFRVVAGSDMNLTAGETYRATHPGSVFVPGPIQEIGVDALRDASGLALGELDVLLGGPPCQAFSVYNHQRGVHDARAGLFRDYLRMVAGLRPKWVVLENVTGITSIAAGGVVRAISEGLASLGYHVEHQILRAEDFGVPQERRRVIFIANRLGEPIVFPDPTHGPVGSGLKPFTTVWNAIGDLPPLGNGEGGEGVPYLSPALGEFQFYARRLEGSLVFNHQAPRLAAVNLERMRHIPIGGSWRDLPFHLLPEGMKRAKRSDHTKRYGRMRPDGLSCTVLTKCDVHWGAYIHPHQDRAISVREAARLQSFPDDFVFRGSLTEQYVQVGNAVPPLLARRVAETLLERSNVARAA